MGFEFFKESLSGVVLVSFNFFVIIIHCCILSARVCEPEGLDLLFSVNQYRNYVSSLDECYMVPSEILLLSDLCCFLTLVLLFEVTLILLNRKK